MDYSLASSPALHTIRWGSCFWICMCVCVSVRFMTVKKTISEALCYWRNNKMCVRVCVCVGEETSKGAHVCSNQAEIDDSLHPWPLLPIKWQFIVQAMWQNQFPFWQLIEIDRLIKQRKRGEQLRRTRRKRTWRRTKVAANTCDALHKQNHCLINSYFSSFSFKSLCWMVSFCVSAKNLGNQPPGHNRFIIFCICLLAREERIGCYLGSWSCVTVQY